MKDIVVDNKKWQPATKIMAASEKCGKKNTFGSHKKNGGLKTNYLAAAKRNKLMAARKQN